MSHKVTLNWKAPDVDATHDAPTQYEIQRGSSAAGPFTTIATIPADVPTYVDTNVKAGDNFFYQVLAKNGAAESLASNEVDAIIPFLSPGAPTNLVADAA